MLLARRGFCRPVGVAILLWSWTAGASVAGGGVAPAAPERLANSGAFGFHRNPTISPFGIDGSYVILWEGAVEGVAGQRLFGRQVDPTGALVDQDFVVHPDRDQPGGAESEPVAIPLGGGGGLVHAWRYSGSQRNSVLAAVFEEVGGPAARSFAVAEDDKDRGYLVAPGLAVSGEEFVVTWLNYPSFDPPRSQVLARFLAVDGSSEASAIALSESLEAEPLNPRVARSAGDGFVVVWHEFETDGSYDAVVGRRLGPSGELRGAPFVVNDYTTAGQVRPDVAALPDGFVVVWASWLQDGDDFGVVARRFRRDGSRVAEEFLVNDFTRGRQRNAQVSTSSAGHILVTWVDSEQGHSLMGRLFDPIEERFGEPFRVNAVDNPSARFDQRSVEFVSRKRFVAAWEVQGGAEDLGSGLLLREFRLSEREGRGCGDPVGSDLTIDSTDALATLRAAVGLVACPICVCDVSGSGDVSAADALAVLRVATRGGFATDCPDCDARAALGW